MIWNVVVFCLAAFAAGGLGIALSNVRVEPRVARQRWIKFANYVLIVTGFLLCTSLGRFMSTLAVGAIAILGSRELLRAAHSRQSRLFRTILLVSYIPLALGALALARNASGQTLAFVFLVVAAFDGFSQVAGQLVGRTLLVPRVSPGKTLEGAIGGAIFAVTTAVLLRGLIGIGVAGAASAGVAISVCALIGDIAASAVKRTAGIKDFGAIFPGHGGVLDRFDSFMVAAPAWFLWTYLLAR